MTSLEDTTANNTTAATTTTTTQEEVNETLPPSEILHAIENNEVNAIDEIDDDEDDNSYDFNQIYLNGESEISPMNKTEVDEVETKEEPEGKLLVAKDNKTDKDIFVITQVSIEQNKLLGHCLVAQKTLQIEMKIIISTKGVYSRYDLLYMI